MATTLGATPAAVTEPVGIGGVGPDSLPLERGNVSNALAKNDDGASAFGMADVPVLADTAPSKAVGTMPWVLADRAGFAPACANWET